ncbi:hypothetical protein SprV_0301237900 [Sparganum proliferum]
MMGSSRNPKRQAIKALVPAISSPSSRLLPETRLLASIGSLHLQAKENISPVSEPTKPLMRAPGAKGRRGGGLRLSMQPHLIYGICHTCTARLTRVLP